MLCRGELLSGPCRRESQIFLQNPGIPNPVKPDGVATTHESLNPASIQNGENVNPGFPTKPGVGDGSPNLGGVQNTVLIGAKPVVPEDWSIANLTLAANLGIVNEPSNPVKPDGVATPHEPSNPAGIQIGENMNPGLPTKPGVGDGSSNPGGVQNTVLVGAKPVVPEDWSIANLTLAANPGVVNEPSNPVKPDGVATPHEPSNPAGIQSGENVNPGFPAKPGAGVGDGSPVQNTVPVGVSITNETPAANPTIVNESQNPPGVQNAAKSDVANASPSPGDDVVNTIRNDAEEMKNDNYDDGVSVKPGVLKVAFPDISNGTPVIGD